MINRRNQFIVNVLLALLGGALISLAFSNPFYPKVDWQGGWLSGIGLIPLLLIKSDNYKRLFWYGFTFGFIYFGSATIWIAEMETMAPLGPLAWLLLTVYLACYPGLLMLGYRFLVKKRLPWWLVFSALWVVLEVARNFIISGFPWVSLAYAHYGNAWLMKCLPLMGVWGLSFITVMINCIVYAILVQCLVFFRNKRVKYFEWFRLEKIKPGTYLLWAIIASLLAGGVMWEHGRIVQSAPAGTFYAAALQGNINQNTAWDKPYQQKVLATYKRLIDQAVDQKAELVVWPETAFPGIFNYDKAIAETVKNWSKELAVNQIVGADEIEPSQSGYQYFNSMILIDKQGRVVEKTAKKHLVPFGEYVPYQDSLLFFVQKIVSRYRGSGFTPGKERRLLSMGAFGQSIPVGGVICFESLFSQYTRQLVSAGAQLLAVITYDTWFGDSAAPALHAVFSAFRAAETNRFLIRAGASGISAIYNNFGQPIGMISLDEQAVLVRQVKAMTYQTTYVRYGDWVVGLLFMIGLICWLYQHYASLRR